MRDLRGLYGYETRHHAIHHRRHVIRHGGGHPHGPPPRAKADVSIAAPSALSTTVVTKITIALLRTTSTRRFCSRGCSRVASGNAVQVEIPLIKSRRRIASPEGTGLTLPQPCNYSRNL